MNIGTEENGLIWTFDENFIPSREYTFSAGSKNFKTFEKDILVYHKNFFSSKSIKEIGDKMNIFFLFYRDEIVLSEINPKAFSDGICIYQEFDEETGKWKPYLYDFDSLEILQEFDEVKKLGLNFSEDFEVLGDFAFQPQIFENLQSALDNSDFGYLISFLFGLSLIYGKFDFRGENLVGAKIHIPLIKNLVQKKDIFDSIINFFADNGIFLKTDLLSKKFGYVYQISILDREILQSFGNFLEDAVGSVQNMKYLKMQELKQKLVNYIENEGNFGNIEFADDVNEGILKILEK